MDEFWSGGDENLGISFFYPEKVYETITSSLGSAEMVKLDFHFLLFFFQMLSKSISGGVPMADPKGDPGIPKKTWLIFV